MKACFSSLGEQVLAHEAKNLVTVFTTGSLMNGRSVKIALMCMQHWCTFQNSLRIPFPETFRCESQGVMFQSQLTLSLNVVVLQKTWEDRKTNQTEKRTKKTKKQGRNEGCAWDLKNVLYNIRTFGEPIEPSTQSARQRQ